MEFIAIEGANPSFSGKEPVAEDRAISSGYFDAMGIGLVSGRKFEINDSMDKSPVVIVNQMFAQQLFQGKGVVGKRIKRVLSDKDWSTIVGIVRDVRGFAPEVSARPQIYHLHNQDQHNAITVVQRVDISILPSLRNIIRQELIRIDPMLTITNFRTMPQLVATALARPRFNTLLLILFAAASLFLMVIGLYGILSYGVSQRTREIGIRMAVGAQRRNVVVMVIRQGMQPALIGLGIGIAGAFILTRLLTSQLYEIKPTDSAAFSVVTLGLVFVSFIACYVPARRAAKIDPMIALRHK